MMRLALLALILLGAPASAQAPDPTSPARYYPLGIGDVWEYDFQPFVGASVQLKRVAIKRDSVVAGVRYAVQVTSRYGNGPGAPPTFRDRWLVRFDPALARVVWLFNGAERFLTCPFNAPFGARLDCDERSGTSPNDPYETRSSGEPGGTVNLGGVMTPVEARKGFVAGFGDGGYNLYAAPIGFISNTGAFCEGCSTRLRYARVGGVEYGRPFVTASEAPPLAQARVAVFPNPAAERVTVALPPGAERVVVFDALGQEVAVRRARFGDHVTLDVSGWPAGVFVVRVSGHAPVRFMVAR